MVAGAQPRDGEPAFDVALFVGYHARAGHPTGTIAHTYNGLPVETRLNGRPTGEYGFNALALGVWGVPVGLVAGDDALAQEVAGWLPWSERVVVKEGFGTSAAASLHPDPARELIRDAASRAVERARAGDLGLLEVDEPVVIEVDYRRGVEADFAALVPGGERIGDRTARHVGPDAISAYRGFLAGVRLATLVD
jgi:D-amino peptidase